MLKSKTKVVPLPDHAHLVAVSAMAEDDPDRVTPDVVLDTKLLVEGSRDGLTAQEVRYMRKKVRRLVRNLRKQYELLGEAVNETHVVDCSINLVERSAKIEFRRVAMNRLLTEAVIDVDLGLIRPRTRKQLASEGITAPRDPLEPERFVTMTGKVYRPFAGPGDNWHELQLDSFRIGKVPTTGIMLFNRMVEDGFLYHPRVRNYLPFRDGETPLEPLGRRDRRALQKRALTQLETPQRQFVREQFAKFVKNLRMRYDHVFEHIDFDIDPFDQTFNLALEVSESFAGSGSPRFSVQGEFDLVWRNRGGAGTALELRLTGGLSRQFQQAVQMMKPINIVGFKVVEDTEGDRREKRNGKRAAASDMLFNILAMSGKISVADHKAAAAAKKERRMFRPTKAERRAHHSSDRMQTRQALHRMRVGGNS